MHQDDGRRRLLVVGADRYFLDACVHHGIDAVVVVGAKHWDDGLIEVPPPLRLLRVDDQTDPEAILSALARAGLADAGWDAVHTGDERALTAVSLLAAHLGCPGLDPGTAIRFRDKSVQKRAVAAAGIPTARHTVLDDIRDVAGVERLPYPCAVLKPIAGAGTARTALVRSVDELRACGVEYAAAGVGARTFLLEEFVPGEEWMVDGVVFDGEIVFASVATYAMPCLSTIREQQPLTTWRFDPVTDRGVHDAALPVAQAALRALGLRRGVFHLELFHDPATGRLTFGECAARRGGALVHEEVQTKFAVDLADATLACALGRRPEPRVERRPDVVGTGYLDGPPGVLVRCPTPADLVERPGVEFARVEAPYGSSRRPAASTNQRIGTVLVTGATPEEFAARMAGVRAWFAARTVVVPAGARGRDLRDWQRRTWPEDDFADTLCR